METEGRKVGSESSASCKPFTVKNKIRRQSLYRLQKLQKNRERKQRKLRREEERKQLGDEVSLMVLT